VSWDVAPGEIVALVGESGCGKSVTALSILQLLPRPAARIVGGSLNFNGEDLLELSAARMRSLRGREIAMIFQEPMTSLNPVLTIGQQIAEPLIQHLELSERAARERSLELLTEVGITDVEHRLGQYPHQLSGGMRQRVAIARAFVVQPSILLADEAFGHLDEVTAAELRETFLALAREYAATAVLITHQLEEAIAVGDRILVFGKSAALLADVHVAQWPKADHLMLREAIQATLQANRPDARLMRV
jgi:ABC-type dipeptide/oligopeptide/nickel transport system ATPase component